MSNTDPDLKPTERNLPVAIDVVDGELIVKRHSGKEESFPLGGGSGFSPSPKWLDLSIGTGLQPEDGLPSSTHSIAEAFVGFWSGEVTLQSTYWTDTTDPSNSNEVTLDSLTYTEDAGVGAYPDISWIAINKSNEVPSRYRPGITEPGMYSCAVSMNYMNTNAQPSAVGARLLNVQTGNIVAPNFFNRTWLIEHCWDSGPTFITDVFILVVSPEDITPDGTGQISGVMPRFFVWHNAGEDMLINGNLSIRKIA
jgi:hypothetical protein